MLPFVVAIVATAAVVKLTGLLDKPAPEAPPRRRREKVVAEDQPRAPQVSRKPPPDESPIIDDEGREIPPGEDL